MFVAWNRVSVEGHLWGYVNNDPVPHNTSRPSVIKCGTNEGQPKKYYHSGLRRVLILNMLKVQDELISTIEGTDKGKGALEVW